MKALLGSLAKKIKEDPLGRKQLKAFISSGLKDSGTIVLSSGKKYRISTSPKNKSLS